MSRLALLILLGALLSLGGYFQTKAPQASAQPARQAQQNVEWRRVQRVVDGDTIILDGKERVRLIGVDTPETVDPRRPVLHFGITDHPTAEWTAQQIVEGFADRDLPQYLIRDRDGIYGNAFRYRLQALEIKEVLTAPQSPWQNGFVERLIGSIRRECLDHIVVLSQRHLRRILKNYLLYYHRSRTHLGLQKDAAESREPISKGVIVVISQVGGLHHRYERRAA